jgi:hypothetical protein
VRPCVRRYVTRHGRHAFEWRSRSLTFYTSRAWVRAAAVPGEAGGGDAAGAWREVPVQDDATVSHMADHALVSLR